MLTLSMESGWQYDQRTPGGHPLEGHFLLQTIKGRAWASPCPLTEEQRPCLCQLQDCWRKDVPALSPVLS